MYLLIALVVLAVLFGARKLRGLNRGPRRSAPIR